MTQFGVILVESRPVEAILASTALSHRRELLVLRAETLPLATRMLKDVPVALGILGKEALEAADGEKLEAFARERVPLVGLGIYLAEALRAHALAVGVQEVHERPREWRAYRSLVSELVDAAINLRTD
ncbi:MAG TPA: hypothetical protein VJN20_08705 [Burkholderiales bacterium]|nr:hypothetical protein [Burkholderiales bacterium]